MLNNSYRFSSAILAYRIKSKFPKLIHSDQNCFLAVPFLGETIRQIFDIINEVKNRIKMTSYYKKKTIYKNKQELQQTNLD